MRGAVGVESGCRIGRTDQRWARLPGTQVPGVGDASRRPGRDKPSGFTGALTTSGLSRRDRSGLTHSPALRLSHSEDSEFR